MRTGCSAAWLARRVWVAEAAGSNPASPTQITGHLRSSRVASLPPVQQQSQQRPGVELLREPLERLERLRVRHLGVDVHRHVDMGMAHNAHSHPGMYVQGREQARARAPDVMNSDLAEPCPVAANLRSSTRRAHRKDGRSRGTPTAAEAIGRQAELQLWLVCGVRVSSAGASLPAAGGRTARAST